MGEVNELEIKRSEKRLKELRKFLIDLDNVCDTLYASLEYDGIWEALMELEDVRVKYYIEFYEHETLIKLKGKK